MANIESFDPLRDELKKIMESTTRENAFIHWDRFWLGMRDIRLQDNLPDFTPSERTQLVVGISKHIPKVFSALIRHGLAVKIEN